MTNLYDGLDYQNRTLLETMSQGRFLKEDEHGEWKIYEDLAEKTLQWEPTPQESRNSNLISSIRGLYLIEDSIATEAKLDNIMQRLEAIELRNHVSVN